MRRFVSLSTAAVIAAAAVAATAPISFAGMIWGL